MWPGALFVLASVVAFGALYPLIGFFGAGAGPFTIAAVLAIGNALAARPSIAVESRGTPMPRAAIWRIAVSGIAGPMLAGSAYAWSVAQGANGHVLTAIIIAAAAAILWEVDNVLSGKIAGADPNAVTVVKCTIGIVAAIVAAVIAHEPLPHAYSGVALILTGAVTLGLSRRWYLTGRERLGQAFPTPKPS
jgi:hypothetical protein